MTQGGLERIGSHPWGTPYQVDLRGADINVSSARTKQETGKSTVIGYRLNKGKAFISNNVPYIRRLNDGHSKQAPVGFIQRAVRKAVTVDFRSFSG